MGQQPSKGGRSATPSSQQHLKQVFDEQQRQREAHQKHAQNAKKIATEGQSELQRSVLGAKHTEETPLLALSHSTGFSLILLRRLQVLFRIISSAITVDNVIDNDELSSALGLSQSSILFLALFKLFDATQTHKVNFRTWVLTLYNLSPQATFDQKCRFSFSLLDLNGDGSIEPQELVNLVQNVIQLSSMDPTHGDQDISDITEEDIHAIVDHALQQADLDGDGEISYDEYYKLMRRSAPFYAAFTIDLDHLCAAFTTPEVQQAVLLSSEEALARTTRFQKKKYQEVIRESFSSHVIPFMQRLSISPGGRGTQSGGHPTFSREGVSQGSPQVENLDTAEWDKFRNQTGSAQPLHPHHHRQLSVNIKSSSGSSGVGPNDHFLFSPTSSLSSPRHNPNSTPSPSHVTGTVADLVRMRTMSGIKSSAIVPASVVNQLSPGGDPDVPGWQLVGNNFWTPPNSHSKAASPTIHPPATASRNNTVKKALFGLDAPKTQPQSKSTQQPAVKPPSQSQSVPVTQKQQQFTQPEPNTDQSAPPLNKPESFGSGVDSYELIGSDGEAAEGVRRQLPTLALEKDIPELERKYSGLARLSSVVAPSPGHHPSLSMDHADASSTPGFGKLVREKSESSLLRPRKSLSQTNLPASSSFQLQSSNSLTNHKPSHSGHHESQPSSKAGSVHSAGPSKTSGVYDFAPSPPASSEALRAVLSPQPKQQLDLLNLPIPEHCQAIPSTHITLHQQPPSSPPINHMLLADLHTISEDGGIPQPTPVYLTAVATAEKVSLQHFIITIENTKEPVQYIVDLLDLDIEEEEEEEPLAMEQVAAPALAKLLAAMREDNPWA